MSCCSSSLVAIVTHRSAPRPATPSGRLPRRPVLGARLLVIPHLTIRPVPNHSGFPAGLRGVLGVGVDLVVVHTIISRRRRSRSRAPRCSCQRESVDSGGAAVLDKAFGDPIKRQRPRRAPRGAPRKEASALWDASGRGTGAGALGGALYCFFADRGGKPAQSRIGPAEGPSVRRPLTLVVVR